jgi:endonuclease/exonuclease/phosphatase family metal-dependent hydrolase
MKLIQLNIWQGRLLDQIIAFLAREKPDIVCLQEVYSSTLDTSFLSSFHSLEHIKAQFPDYSVFFSPTQQMRVLDNDVFYGNAILSRFPLEDTETIFIDGNYEVQTTAHDANFNIRNLQRATVRLSDEQKVYVLNHHGYWEQNPVGSAVTIEKMQQVADTVANTGRPLILAGDFNITPYSPAMQPIHKLLQDLTEEHELATTLSIFSKINAVACDYICISEDIIPSSFGVKETIVSDHLALALEFDLPQSN